MSWERKDQPTPYDQQLISGLHFLDGDVVGEAYQQDWIRGHKYPLIQYSSGVERQLHGEEGHEVIHIFGALDLPLRSTRDEAYERAQSLASEYDYSVRRQGERRLMIANPHSERSYQVIFDNEGRSISNIILYPPPHEAMELLDGVSRAVLPPLYHNEEKGLEAIAPVKFFTPDSQWTWYPTEFDGRDICFGLVSGFEVELGYFSMSELEGVRGLFGLPIERDLYFQPASLNELMTLHKEQRGN